MARESNTGLGVSNFYGSRNTGGYEGSYRTSGVTREFVVDFTGASLAAGDFTKVLIPAGAAVVKAVVFIDQAFDVQALSVLSVGTLGAAAANGLDITEAQLEATGRYDVTASLAGTWDAEARLAAATNIQVLFTVGGLTASTGAATGRGRVVIEVEDI